MKISSLHDWNVTIDEAVVLQKTLANRVITQGNIKDVSRIAGFDISVDKASKAVAAGVVLSYPQMKLIEQVILKGEINFPYVPGLLSFREIPLLQKVCGKLENEPDLVIVDGQGVAHPRFFGLASHLGLLLDKPTIGCAKTPLFGKYSMPDYGAGAFSWIKNPHGDTIIGAVVRTKAGTKPLFVSTGHKIELSSAVYWVIQCCQGYRLPEPTRLAHLASRAN